ncbi:MAG: GNAT family N-acetyltransferase [Candidatus Hodarchaeota archaeon]
MLLELKKGINLEYKMSLKILSASIEDKNEIYKALLIYSKELEQFQENQTGEITSDKYFDHYWTESDRFPFVAYINNELIGFCLLRAREKYYSIAEFYIKSKFRRLGHGKSLLDFIIGFCKEQGTHSSIMANSLIKNLTAHYFWIANGFITLKEVSHENERYYSNLMEF